MTSLRLGMFEPFITAQAQQFKAGRYAPSQPSLRALAAQRHQ
jgi:hypothetical protein